MFKLVELEFVNHPFFNSMPIRFIGENEERNEKYTTLIIGPNGTGKSQILLAIINIFNSLYYFKGYDHIKYNFQYDYKLKYIKFDKLFELSYIENKLIIESNTYKYPFIEKRYLPSKILISAYSFNDKYPIRGSRGKIINDSYHYLGLKSTTNNIFISNPSKDVINRLFHAIQNNKYILPIKEAFLALDLKPELRVVYKKGKHFKFFKNKLFKNIIKINYAQFRSNFLGHIKKERSSSEMNKFSIDKIESLLLKSNEIEIAINFIRDNLEQITTLNNDELLFAPNINFDNRNSIETFARFIEPIQILSNLELISFDKFEVIKSNSSFPFDSASSGEYHIIFSFLNMISVIEENSLVLIDEPEISLHPNWQIKYMDIFNKIFSHYPNTHFILASHSHFIVSDLQSNNSVIIALELDSNNDIKLTKTEKSTYGWSAEQILLDVFNVITTRNYYLTRVVGNILFHLSQVDYNRADIVKEINSLKEYDLNNLNDNDPIKLVIKKLIAKVDS